MGISRPASVCARTGDRPRRSAACRYQFYPERSDHEPLVGGRCVVGYVQCGGGDCGAADSLESEPFRTGQWCDGLRHRDHARHRICHGRHRLHSALYVGHRGHRNRECDDRCDVGWSAVHRIRRRTMGRGRRMARPRSDTTPVDNPSRPQRDLFGADSLDRPNKDDGAGDSARSICRRNLRRRLARCCRALPDHGSCLDHGRRLHHRRHRHQRSRPRASAANGARIASRLDRRPDF